MHRTSFRGVNDAIAQLAEGALWSEHETLLEFVCECADATCLERFAATRVEFGEAAGAETSLVIPEHAAWAKAISGTDRFVVVGP